jgi:hypothetical protein
VFTDEEVVRLCRGARNATKFEALYDRGDLDEYAGDDSRADQALMSIMAFYTQNPEQLDRLVRDSALYRSEKWGRRPDYRRRTIEKALRSLKQTYEPAANTRVDTNSDRKPASPSPSSYRGSGRRDDGPELIRLSEVEPPGPRRYLLQDLVLASYVTLLYGDGGVAKSLLALALALAIAGDADTWLGRRVEGGTVLYIDFELDAEEQARRVRQLCRGAGVEQPPKDLLYMSAVGYEARDIFKAAHEACEEHGVAIVVLDSYGVALEGDAEAKEVIAFNKHMLEPFRALARIIHGIEFRR